MQKLGTIDLETFKQAHVECLGDARLCKRAHQTQLTVLGIGEQLQKLDNRDGVDWNKDGSRVIVVGQKIHLGGELSLSVDADAHYDVVTGELQRLQVEAPGGSRKLAQFDRFEQGETFYLNLDGVETGVQVDRGRKVVTVMGERP